MTIYARCPVLLLAALGGMTPSVVLADASPTRNRPPSMGGATGWPQAGLSDPLVVGIVTVALLVVAALMLTGRLHWRLGAIVVVGCCALFGGDAFVDGAVTAIAISR